MNLTPEILSRCMPQAKPANVAAWVGPLRDAMAAHDMNTPQRMAGFLASVANETGSLSAEKEVSYFSTDYDYAREKVFGRRMPSREVWESWRAQGREAFYKLSFDHLYSDVLWPFLGLGNTEPGDGSKYVARGPGITGRANYRALGKKLNLDLEGNPDLLLDPAVAAPAYARMWVDVGNNERMDQGGIYSAMQVLNPGGSGDFFNPHIAYYNRILGVLKGGAGGVDVAAVQRALNAEGSAYPPLVADGVIGPMTIRRIKEFQMAGGDEQTGRIDAKLLAALGISRAAA